MLNQLNVFISRRRWLKRILMRFLPPKAHVYLKSHHMTLFYNPKDLRGPSFHIAYDLDQGFCNYEEVEKKEIIDHLPPHGLFVDIGANIGLFSYYILGQRQDIKIEAYEPDPDNFHLLEETKKANAFKHINIHQQAIGKEQGQIKLYKSISNDGGHSTVFQGQDISPSDYNTVTVSPLKKFDCPINVIKIDVEGAELEVLKGSLDVIKQDQPMLLIETSNELLAKKEGLYSFFTEHFPHNLLIRIPGNKKIYTLDNLADIANQRLSENHPYNNYIFQFTT